MDSTGLAEIAPKHREAFAVGDDTPEALARCRHCGQPRRDHGGAQQTGRCPTSTTRYAVHPDARNAMRALDAAEITSAVAHATVRHDAARTRGHKLRSGQWGIGASDVGSCPKQIEYRERPPADYVPVVIDKRAAHVGTAIHEAWTTDRRVLFPWRSFAGKVAIPGLDRPSEYDEYDPILGRLTDYKSAGQYMWGKVAAGPWWAHVAQAQLYAYGLRAAGSYVREIEILYIDRATGGEEIHRLPYDEDAALGELDRLVEIATRLDAGLELERAYSGPSTNPLCREYCPAVEHCWNVKAAEVRGRSPESHTLVITDDDEIEAVQGLYVAAAAANTADRERKEARALVDGLPSGHYGEDLDLKVSGGNLGDPKPDHMARIGQLERWINMDPAIRPAFSELEYPTFRSRSPITYRVTPARVASA